MASIQEILSGQSYKGDATSGGGAAVAVTIDTSPLQKLADFTFYQNRDLWERKNKQDAETAKEIAGFTALDPSSYLPEQYKLLSEKKNKITKMMEEDPSILNYQLNPDGWLAYNKELSEWGNMKKQAVANDLIYSKEQAGIDNDLNPYSKAAKQKLLDKSIQEHFAKGAEFALTQLPTLRSGYEFKPEDAKIPTITSSENQISYIEPNTLVEKKFSIKNGAQMMLDSEKLAIGIMTPYRDNPELDPEKNAELKLVYETNQKSGNSQILLQAVDKYNEWMMKKKQNPNEAMPPQVNEIMQLIETYNKEKDIANSEIAKYESLGHQYLGGRFKDVDVTELSLGELIYLNGIAGKPLITQVTDRKWTGGANAMQMNREDNAAAMSRAMLPFTMAKLGTAGSGSGKASGNDKAILEPSMFFRENAIRLGDWFRRNPKSEGMVLNSSNTDPATSEALGIGKDGVKTVKMRKDGGFVQYDNNGKQIGVGTPEEMFRRYKVVSAGKLGVKTDKEGNVIGGETAMPEGWQLNVEDGMTEIFGTKNAGEAFKQSFNIGMQKDAQQSANTIEVKNPDTGETEVWDLTTKKRIK